LAEETRPEEEEGRNLVCGLSLLAGVATNAKSETEPCAGRKLCFQIFRQTIEQKKRLHPKMEPSDRAEAKSKVVANGRGRRIRHLPGGHLSREEDTTSARVSQNWTEGGEYGAIHIDNANMDFDRLVSNAAGVMSAMRPMQVKVSLAALRSRARERPGPA
jgi:hypothetical protein